MDVLLIVLSLALILSLLGLIGLVSRLEGR